MKQKVALTAAHLLCEGQVADMGMGSGSGSHALAALYPSLQVTGVDVNPTMVALAAQTYQLPNLNFIAGDVAEPCFPAGSLQGIFDSSVLHHVTTFSNYDHARAAHALRQQSEQLAPYGSLIVRDFLAPEPQRVELTLNEADAELLRQFSREFRRLHAQPGFPLEEPSPGRFELDHRHAVEFLLRKDYRSDWETEVLEEYTYFTQAQFEECFAALGLRVLASTPLRNPWIVRHRFEGKFSLRDLAGQELDPPATNYVIVGEKVPPGEGVRFRELEPAPPLGFLSLHSYRDTRTGKVRDLARRPHRTLDVVPFFRRGEEVFVLARQSYPRPLLSSDPRGTPSLGGTRAVSYVVEPLTALQGEEPLGRTVERLLAERAALQPAQIVAVWGGAKYYPSPGGIEEEVRSVWVEIEPVLALQAPVRLPFSTAGQVRAIEAQQLLRAAQVDGLPDARLEGNVLELLRALKVPLDPWIGAEIEVAEGPALQPGSLEQERRRVFLPHAEPSGFLRIECAVFQELNARGEEVGRQTLELVVPERLSCNTVATALLRRWQGRLYLGVDDDDLPAVQGFTGNSQVLVAPAWRLPREVDGLRRLHAWLRQQLRAEYGLSAGHIFELGGRYHPTPGLTPELVYPLAVEVEDARDGRPLRWIELGHLLTRLAEVQDAHLRTLAQRAGWALGLFSSG